MGNYSEFRRVVEYLIKNVDFDKDVSSFGFIFAKTNVSVLNIRLINQSVFILHMFIIIVVQKNVSVFETNIRIVGGLLSAHLLSHKAGMELEVGCEC